MNALTFLILFPLSISLLALILPVGLVIRKSVGVCPVKCLSTDKRIPPHDGKNNGNMRNAS